MNWFVGKELSSLALVRTRISTFPCNRNFIWSNVELIELISKLPNHNLSEWSFLHFFKILYLSSWVSSFILVKGLKTLSELFDNLVSLFIFLSDKHLEFQISVKQDSLYSQLKLKMQLMKVKNYWLKYGYFFDK